jgi:hypothetical protein
MMNFISEPRLTFNYGDDEEEESQEKGDTPSSMN